MRLLFFPSGLLAAILCIMSPFGGSALGADKKAADDRRPRLVAQKGHGADLLFLAVRCSPDGKLLASSGHGERSVRIWEAATGRLVRVLEPPPQDFTPPALPDFVPSANALFCDDNKSVLTITHSTIRRWEMDSSRSVPVFEADKGVRIMSVANEGQWFTTEKNGDLHLWETATGKEIQVFKNQGKNLAAAQPVSDDGKIKWLVIVENFDPFSRERAIRLLDVPTGKVSQTFNKAYGDILVSGRWVGVAGTESTWLWELAAGQKGPTFTLQNKQGSVALANDGRLFASGSDQFDRDFSAKICNTDGKVFSLKWHGTSIKSMEFSPDGKLLFTAESDGVLRSWDTGSGQLVRVFECGANLLASMAISKNGESFAAIDAKQDPNGVASSHVARLWNLREGKPFRVIEGASTPVWSADGKRLVTGGNNKTCRVWDAPFNKETLVLRQNREEEFNRLALSDDGKLLANDGVEGVHLWDLTSGKEVRFIRRQGGGEQDSMILSGDGKWLLVSGLSARLWETAADKEPRVFVGGNGVAITADSKSCIIAQGGKLRWIDIGSDKEIRTLTADGVGSFSISNDNRWVTGTSGVVRKMVGIWNAETGKEVRDFKVFEVFNENPPLLLKAALTWAFTQDGKRLLTFGGNDSEIRLWDTIAGKELCRFISFRDGTWAVYDAEGRFDAPADGNVAGLIWAIGGETFPLQRFKDRFFDPGLLAKHLGFNRQALRFVAPK